MSGSSPAGYSTSTQTATPGGSGLDYMNQGLGFGGNLYNQGSTHAFLNGDQVSGLNEIARIAGSGNQTANQMYDLAQGFTGGKYLNSNIANPGLQSLAGNSMNTDAQQRTLGTIGTTAQNNPVNGYLQYFAGNGATGADQTALNNFGGGPGATAGAQRMLGDTASGKYLDPSTNPWLKSTYDQAFGNVQNSVGSAMAGAGRFGSGAMAGALGSGATNLANEIYGTNFQNERNRQLQAQQTMGQFQTADRAQQIQALINAGQLASADRGQQIGAAGKMGDLWDTGLGLGISAATNAGQLRQNDARTMLGASSQLSQNYNAGLDATTRMAALSPALNEARYADMAHLLQAGQAFQQDQQGGLTEPWQRLSDYMGLARGMPTTSTQSTSNPYYSNPTGQALSGALGGSALLSQLFGGSGALGTGPSAASNIGSAVSGAGGWLSRLFSGGGGAVPSSLGAGADYSAVGSNLSGALGGTGGGTNYWDPSYGTGGQSFNFFGQPG
jgi:hypothetical protein